MLTPTEILEQISKHYAEQLDATQNAVEELDRKHSAFMRNLDKLLDVKLQLAGSIKAIKPPAEDGDVNLFAVSIEDTSGEAALFPNYIGRTWGLCESVNASGVSTALYARVGYEQDS